MNNISDLRERQCIGAIQLLPESQTTEEFHDQKRPALRCDADIEQGNHIGMLKTRQDSRLAAEAFDRAGPADPVLRDDFDRNFALKLQIGRLVYNPHSTLADSALKLETFIQARRNGNCNEPRPILKASSEIRRVTPAARRTFRA